MIEKIPYLQALGITAVELLPVFEFDDSETSLNPAGEPIRNYWGYSTRRLLQPARAATAWSGGTARTSNEFRDLVKALHKAGIEVILDVVFNHTDEGNELGPTYSFRGHRQPRRSTCSTPTTRPSYRELQRLRQHVQRESSAAAEVHRRLPAVLGGGDARRRLPLRRRIDSGARRGRARRWCILRSSGRSSSTTRSRTRR